jgi:hypothetical protein
MVSLDFAWSCGERLGNSRHGYEPMSSWRFMPNTRPATRARSKSSARGNG